MVFGHLADYAPSAKGRLDLVRAKGGAWLECHVREAFRILSP